MPRLVRFLVSFFLLDIFTMCADSSDLPTCPIWTYPSISGNECVCGDNLEDVITCNQKSLTVQLNRRFYCFMLLNDNGVNTTLLGTCPYGDSVRLSRNFSMSHIYLWGQQVVLILQSNRTALRRIHVQKTTPSLPIHITLAVSNAKITTKDGLSS